MRSPNNFLLVLVALCASIARAHADAPSTPQQLTESGLRRFQVGEYAKAIEEFKQAYLVDPQPPLLYNIAQAHRLSHDCVQAKRFYLNYLHDAPAAPNRAAVEQRIAEMQRCIDEHPAPPAEPVPVAPARAPAPPVPPAPTPAPAPHRAPPLRAYKVAGLATLGAGVVLLGVAVAMNVRAVQASNDVGAFFQSGGQWSADQRATEARGQDASKAAIALYTVGGVAAATGAVLTALGFAKRSAGRPDVAVGASGATVGWSCAF